MSEVNNYIDIHEICLRKKRGRFSVVIPLLGECSKLFWNNHISSPMQKCMCFHDWTIRVSIDLHPKFCARKLPKCCFESRLQCFSWNSSVSMNPFLLFVPASIIHAPNGVSPAVGTIKLESPSYYCNSYTPPGADNPSTMAPVAYSTYTVSIW